MCMNCGCGRPHDRHDDPANITAADLRRAAEANGQSLRESAQHIVEAVEVLEAGAVGQQGLAEPAGGAGVRPSGRGTPASES